MYTCDIINGYITLSFVIIIIGGLAIFSAFMVGWGYGRVEALNLPHYKCIEHAAETADLEMLNRCDQFKL
tara:strand:- start:380 stop:589 length:210 start_codon:yes stop_codon:yes gene_type:complete